MPGRSTGRFFLDGRIINVVLRCCDSGDLFVMMQVVRECQNHPGDAPGMTEGESRFWGVAYMLARQSTLPSRLVSRKRLDR